MNRFLTIPFFTLTLILSSCLPEPLKIDVPAAEEELVVSSILLPDQGIGIVLTRSFSALSSGFGSDSTLLEEILVEDALVVLQSDNSVIQLEEISSGIYSSLNSPLQEGVTYQLKVNSNEQELSAASELKPAVQFSSLRTELEPNAIDSIPYVYYEFQDLADDNYYMINVQRLPTQEDELLNLISSRTYAELITDKEVSNGIVKGNFPVLDREDFENGDVLVVSLSHISKEYYDYLNKRNGNTLIFDFVSEPGNLPTNVNGGKGFFSLYIPDTRIQVIGL